MSLQFEPALNVLLNSRYEGDAVHMALALNSYGLVQTNPQQRQQYLQAQEPGKGVVNLLKIVQKYCSDFQTSKPVEAFHFFLFLYRNPLRPSRSIGGPMDNKEVLVAMRDLILKTRRWPELVGRLKGNKIEQDGAVFKFLETREAVNLLVNEEMGAAKQAKKEGNHLDAIHLYTLADDWQGLTETIVFHLSKVVANDPRDEARSQLMERLQAFLARNQSREQGEKAKCLEKLRFLKEIAKFFNLYYAGEFNEAEAQVDFLQLVPPPDAGYAQKER